MNPEKVYSVSNVIFKLHEHTPKSTLFRCLLGGGFYPPPPPPLITKGTTYLYPKIVHFLQHPVTEKVRFLHFSNNAPYPGSRGGVSAKELR